MRYFFIAVFAATFALVVAHTATEAVANNASKTRTDSPIAQEHITTLGGQRIPLNFYY